MSARQASPPSGGTSEKLREFLRADASAPEPMSRGERSRSGICVTKVGASDACAAVEWFDDNVKSLVLFGAILAPVLAAAIHGVLATTQYIKVAEASRQTADRIGSLVDGVTSFAPSGVPAVPESLEPIRAAVASFADATVNDASGWRAMLRDKNIPLA